MKHMHFLHDKLNSSESCDKTVDDKQGENWGQAWVGKTEDEERNIQILKSICSAGGEVLRGRRPGHD